MEIEIIYKNIDSTMFFKKFLIFSLKGGNLVLLLNMVDVKTPLRWPVIPVVPVWNKYAVSMRLISDNQNKF